MLLVIILFDQGRIFNFQSIHYTLVYNYTSTYSLNKHTLYLSFYANICIKGVNESS